jgi:hypothetical protein
MLTEAKGLNYFLTMQNLEVKRVELLAKLGKKAGREANAIGTQKASKMVAEKV